MTSGYDPVGADGVGFATPLTKNEVRETAILMDDQVYNVVESYSGTSYTINVAELGITVTGVTLDGAAGQLKDRMVEMLRPAGKSRHQMRVERFMRRLGVASGNNQLHALRSVPGGTEEEGEMTLGERKLRARLMLEEVLETINNGLGLEVSFRGRWGEDYVVIGQVDYDDRGNGVDLVALADGVCDIKVTATGTLSAAGIRDNMIQVIVDSANLKKFSGDGHVDVDTGKWIKPTDFVPPDIEIGIELTKQKDDSYSISIPIGMDRTIPISSGALPPNLKGVNVKG